jgi:membrane protein DedA with SNARE-associated domain
VGEVPVASLTTSVTDFVTGHGVYAVFLLMLVDAVLPAASELVMVAGGALAAGAFSTHSVDVFGGEISSPFWIYFSIAMAGTIGYTVGSLIGWGIGAYAGRPFLERHGRRLHLSADRLDRAEAWFDRHGDWAVFLGRITPVVRSFVSIPAGVVRMRLGLYTVLTLLGSALWCYAFGGIGWGAGTGYKHFHHNFEYVSIGIAVAVVAAIAFWLWRRSRPSSAASRERGDALAREKQAMQGRRESPYAKSYGGD